MEGKLICQVYLHLLTGMCVCVCVFGMGGRGHLGTCPFKKKMYIFFGMHAGGGLSVALNINIELIII